MERTSLTHDDLPKEIGTLRIVYLTDIHKGGLYTDTDLANLVTQVNSLRADIILLGGDYATDPESAVAFFKSCPSFHASYAVLGVLGDTDRSGGEVDLQSVRSAMVAAGITPLVNEVARVRIGGSASVYIAGLDDSTGGTPDAASVAKQVGQDDYVILLAHSPSVIPDALAATDKDGHKNWFDLGLFGHTHGGQLAIGGTLLVGGDVEDRYRGGWLQENRIDLLISRGVGTTGLPIRFLCKPQIHVITVSSGS